MGCESMEYIVRCRRNQISFLAWGLELFQIDVGVERPGTTKTNHELVELRVARLVAARRPSVQLRRHGRQPLQHVRRRADLRRVIPLACSVHGLRIKLSKS